MVVSPPRAETAVDQRLGQIAVRKGKISSEQLKVALEEQAAGVRRGRKKPRRLGVILAEKGWVSDAEVRVLLEEQEAWLLSQETRSREEALLGQVLIDAGLAAPEHVRDGLRIQFEAMELGEDPPRLGDLLVQRGWARPEDVAQGLELKAALSEAPPAEPEPPPAPPPPAEPAGAEKIGKYRLVRTIGSGGGGVVYEAEDPDLGRRVALKVLRRDLEPGGAGPREVERFLREAQMVARIPKHAGLAEVYETGQHDGRHFIAMELIRGQTFAAWR
ncbi:MAG TPA: hypothetical protein VEJ18_08995, partial [Planctomycetota bacterium]|nr:hypothetical protein [Planctomycetota bacterium]